MPITNRVGDLLNDTITNIRAHQANLFHTFGGGIARLIGQVFPEAYEADCKTEHGDSAKLGTYSHARCKDGTIWLNCYSQRGMGAQDRNTSYDEIVTIFTTIESKLRLANQVRAKNNKPPFVLGVPYKYGCGLAGGRWRVVYSIFEDIFKDSPVELHIVRLESEEEILLD